MTDRVENVERLANSLTSLAEGDLSQTIDKPFITALDRLRCDFNAAFGKAARCHGKRAQQCRDDRCGSPSDTYIRDELAKRTEQQAASVEETARCA